jgi:PhnB protein
MSVNLNPYLSFRDNAREALEFYRSVFGGELAIMTFADMQSSEDPSEANPSEANKIMHGMLETTGGLVLMAADTPTGMEYAAPAGMSVSLSGDDEAELRRYWEGLSASGTSVLPLERAPWGDHFGMCFDKFGVSWMVNITASPG